MTKYGVTFTFKKCETTTYDEAYFDSILPPASVLRTCLQQCYLKYHKFMSTDKVFVEKNQMKNVNQEKDSESGNFRLGKWRN